MAPTSCFTGQVHRLRDAREAYGAMITRAKAVPPKAATPTSRPSQHFRLTHPALADLHEVRSPEHSNVSLDIFPLIGAHFTVAFLAIPGGFEVYHF